jgi:hypothetical protein
MQKPIILIKKDEVSSYQKKDNVIGKIGKTEFGKGNSKITFFKSDVSIIRKGKVGTPGYPFLKQPFWGFSPEMDKSDASKVKKYKSSFAITKELEVVLEDLQVGAYIALIDNYNEISEMVKKENEDNKKNAKPKEKVVTVTESKYLPSACCNAAKEGRTVDRNSPEFMELVRKYIKPLFWHPDDGKGGQDMNKPAKVKVHSPYKEGKTENGIKDLDLGAVIQNADAKSDAEKYFDPNLFKVPIYDESQKGKGTAFGYITGFFKPNRIFWGNHGIDKEGNEYSFVGSYDFLLHSSSLLKENINQREVTKEEENIFESELKAPVDPRLMDDEKKEEGEEENLEIVEDE